MQIYWSAFFLVLFSEAADKSRLAGFLLAAAFKAPWPVFWGMTLGYALIEALAVALGVFFSGRLTQERLDLAAGILFVAVGLGTLWMAEEAQERAEKWLKKARTFGPFLVSFAVIAFTEIADRTQIAMTALSAETRKPWIVYAGGMSSLTFLNALTVWAGEAVAKRWGGSRANKAAGAVFILAGLALLVRSFWKVQ